LIAIDLVGPFKAKGKNIFLVVMVDVFTKWPTVVPIITKTKEAVLEAINDHLITRHSAPRAIMTDRGGEFINQTMKDFCEKSGIKHYATKGLNPAGNGVVERFNRYLGAALTMFANKYKTDFLEYLQPILLAYRVSVHESTGYSPFELEYGRKPVHPFHIHLDIGRQEEETVQTYGSRTATRLKTVYEEVRQMQMRMTAINRENNKGRYTPVKYKTDDFVLYWNPKKIKDPESTGSYRPQKLCWRWSMPYRVTKRINEWTFEITNDTHTIEASVNRMRLYLPWNDHCMDTSPWLAGQEPGEQEANEDDGVIYDRIPPGGIPLGSLIAIPTTFELQPFAIGRVIRRAVALRETKTLLVVQWYHNNKRTLEGKYYPGWRYKEKGIWYEHYSDTRPRNTAIACMNDFEFDLTEIDESTVCWHGFELENKQIPTAIMDKIKDSGYIDYS
jgi:hypothetical protein